MSREELANKWFEEFKQEHPEIDVSGINPQEIMKMVGRTNELLDDYRMF